jgi:hypothetical protein
MKKKKIDVIKSNVSGAVFIHRDTSKYDRRCVYVTPAVIGLKKYAGCTEFGPGDTNHTSRYWRKKGFKGRTIIALTPKECDKIYFDIPDKAEAWLVTPHGKAQGYLWTPVTDEIGFSRH